MKIFCDDCKEWIDKDLWRQDDEAFICADCMDGHHGFYHNEWRCGMMSVFMYAVKTTEGDITPEKLKELIK